LRVQRYAIITLLQLKNQL